MKKLIVWLSNKRILNNIVFNNIIIFLRLDDWFAHYVNTYNFYNDHNPDNTKTLQEIAGYSNTPVMNELLQDIHNELNTVKDEHLADGGAVLDIGCGPGLFLKNFDERYSKSGIDITPGMIELAKKEIPDGSFKVGDFLKEEIEGSFDMIFSVGTLMYLSKSTMKKFARKTSALLKPGGIIFYSYPHAIAKKDLFYPDLHYNQYSPLFIERLYSEGFEVLMHSRAVDKKKIGKFDGAPFVHPTNPEFKTYRNSSIIVLRKK